MAVQPQGLTAATPGAGADRQGGQVVNTRELRNDAKYVHELDIPLRSCFGRGHAREFSRRSDQKGSELEETRWAFPHQRKYNPNLLPRLAVEVLDDT